MKQILVLDTTLRDGEQVPGAKLILPQKLEIARQMERLQVDILEAGFPASSPGDFEAVSQIAKQVGKQMMITALGRAVKPDIDAVYESVRFAERPLIHIVLGASDIHVDKKFGKSRDAVLEMGVSAVRYAKTLLPEVQYSTEDASRAEFEYLWKTIEAVVKAGATMINIPDTVGFAVPEEFGALVSRINDRLMNLNPNVILSVHCHNDSGLATANTLAAIRNGARKVEVTINGIGERAGNAALEEVVMGLKLRRDYYQADTRINTREIKNTSRMASILMGLDVQVNKAITGDNAFAHSSGIHQDGLLKSRDAYEVIHPEDVGVGEMELVLTARSGRHAVRNALAEIGYQTIAEDDFEAVFARFLNLADHKKEVYTHDLFQLVEEVRPQQHVDSGAGIQGKLFRLVDVSVTSRLGDPSATIVLSGESGEKTVHATGDGPIDALFTAIRDASGFELPLEEYRVQSISRGKEAQGKVSITVKHNGKSIRARAVGTDIIQTSAQAMVQALNSVVAEEYRIASEIGKQTA